MHYTCTIRLIMVNRTMKGINMRKIKSKHNNLMNYFICNHKDLSKAYIKKSEKFFKEISDKLEKGYKKIK